MVTRQEVIQLTQIGRGGILLAALPRGIGLDRRAIFTRVLCVVMIIA